MASFSTVQAGDAVNSTNLNQLIDALAGNANIPISVTGVNDASLYALDVRNQDATNQRSFRVRNSSADNMIVVDGNGVAINQVNISSGTIGGSTISSATITGSTITTGTLSLLAASSNTVRTPAARVWHNATQTLLDNTATILNFNSERYDNDGLHSTTANSSRMVASRPGIWHIGASVDISSNGAGFRYIAIVVNSNVIAWHAMSAATVSISSLLTIATDWNLSTSDTVSVQVSQNSGGSLQTSTAANYGCEFWMHYVGAS